MNTNIHSINLPQIVQIGWGNHVDFCLWKNRPLLLAKGVYYSNQSSLNAARCNCLTRGGICRIGCANAFSGHRPHCSPLRVHAISCSCKARQARASPKCSWSGRHTASVGTMTGYVWALSHKLTNRGHRAWCRGWFITAWKEWWQRPWW